MMSSAATCCFVHPKLVASALLLALMGLVLASVTALRATADAGASRPLFDSLLHWHDSHSDWLLVADGRADVLTIYSAADGRRLSRVPIADGLRDADALSRRHGHLFVIHDDGRQNELQASSLQRMVAAGR